MKILETNTNCSRLVLGLVLKQLVKTKIMMVIIYSMMQEHTVIHILDTNLKIATI
nr:MAG TPA: hypothetical protein [Caudoviricetes sp.]